MTPTRREAGGRTWEPSGRCLLSTLPPSAGAGGRGRPLLSRVVAPFIIIIIFFFFFGPAPVRAQPPDAAWRTLETEHFRVTYHSGLASLAGRAADRAERAYGELTEAFVPPPRGRIDLVLTDHSDLSNGFANVNPSNRITIFARPPVDALALSFFDEWLELVITHELAHIFHLDRTGPIGSAIRAVFGRLPVSWPVFPGRSVPGWTIEGIATFYESALTGAGRTHGTNHEMIVRTAILAGTFERIDQVSGASPVWPGGGRIYIYGSLFFDHLLERYGQERMARFVDAVAGQWVPYRMDSAAQRAFGISFTDAWEEWRAELEREYALLAASLAEQAPLTRPETFVRGGRAPLDPRVSPSGDRLAITRADGRSDPQLRVMALDGSESRRVTAADGAPTFAWETDSTLLLARIEWEDRHRIWSDLHRVEIDGRTERLTRGARVSHPDRDPASGRIVAVQEGEGTNRLVEIDRVSGDILPFGDFLPDEHWSAPRWSPDGRWIAAARWRSGARFDLVVFPPDGGPGEAIEITADRAVDTSPAWSPDGRWLLWSSDRSGIPNLLAIAVDPERGPSGGVRQVTNLLGGALHPAMDPGGRWIFYSGYHADGWAIDRIPFDPSSWFDPFPVDPRFTESGDRLAGPFPRDEADLLPAPETEHSSRPYRAARSLLPRHWEPVIRAGENARHSGPAEDPRVEVVSPRYGATIGGRDLVGRHEYDITGVWAPATDLVEGSAVYSFAGLGNPVLTAWLDQEHLAGGWLVTEGEDSLFFRIRERSVGGSATILRQRVRSVAALTLSGRHLWQERSLLRPDLEPTTAYRLAQPDRRLGEGTLTLSFGTARFHPLSISAEDGVSGFVRTRARRELERSPEGEQEIDGGFDELTGSLRLFRSVGGRGFANQVVALRATGGVAGGNGAGSSHFRLGGASGQAETFTGLDLFGGRSLLFPMRGYATTSRVGRYAWSASAEYRVPLAILHRGAGLLPFHLDRVSGALFLDGGDAWGGVGGAGTAPAGTPLLSGGAELLVSGLPFWTTSTTLRLGVAHPFIEGNGPSFHLRIGPSF